VKSTEFKKIKDDLDKILEKERNKLLTEKEILQIKKVVLNTLTNKDLSQIQEALDKFILDGDISPLKFALSEVFSEDEILDMRKALYSKPNKIIAFRPMSTNIRLANRLSPAERLQITSDNKTTFSEEEVLQITRAFSKTLSEADISKITNIFFKALSERELTLLKDKLHYTTDRPSSVLAFLTGIGVIIGILHNFELIPWYYSTATLAVGAGALAPKIKKAIQEWMIEQKKKVKNKCAMVFSPQK